MPLTETEKKNIADGFKAAGDKINHIEEESKAAIQELQKETDTIVNQLRKYGRSVLNASREHGSYRGFWETEEQAKEFGELILKAIGRKDLGESVSSEGGVLVPTELSDFLIQKLGKYGKFRRNTMVLPLGSDKRIVPKVETDLTVYSPNEGGAITKSDMQFSMVGLTPHKLCCLAAASSELEEDSVAALGEIIGLSMTRSIAKKEDLIGFLGDGTETYFGMTGITGALRAVAEAIADIAGLIVGSGNAYSELTLGDFREVIGILPEDADEGAKWYMSKKFYYNVVYPLAESAGVANIFEILSDRKGRFLLGYPVEFVSAMPSSEANSQICALLGDLQLGSYLGERKSLIIERSKDVYFVNDLIGFRGKERIDINAYGVGDTSEAGAIVGLITAAS